MDIQNEIRNWISAQLEKMGHGAKGKLAAHLGVRPDAITRMLNNSPDKEARVIRADELVKIGVFFGATPPGLSAHPGDEDAEFFNLYDNATPEERAAALAFLKTLSSSRRK
ncbi:hypothetical protein ACWF50_13255 [Brucella pseudogrignonensis]